MNTIFILQIRALSFNVLKEAVRDRVLHILVGSGILILFSSIVFGEMAIGGRQRVLQNMGFWVLGIWGLISVIYLGSGITRRELRQKTIYLVLSRPLNRPTFLIGKYAGILLTMFFTFLILSAVWLFICRSFGIVLTLNHAAALGFIFGEWVLLATFSLFFSSFTSPLLHNFFLVGIYFLGHWSNDLRLFSENAQSEYLKVLLKGFYYVLPNLEALNFREAALYDQALNSALLLKGGLVLTAWTLTMLLAANIIFSRRKII